jgi:hypothetical protein
VSRWVSAVRQTFGTADPFRTSELGKTAKATDAESSETLVALLLPIGRLMIKGGLGVGDLIRAGKKAYVRAAIACVTPPGVRINASRLSVITGLTRKEVTAIVNELKGTPTTHFGAVKEQRALRVLRGWKRDPRFCDNKGEPARLPLRGDRRSFSALVREYGGDVTPNSVLKELERMKVVTFSRSRGLRLRSTRVRAKSTEHMADLARLFPDFANTVGPHGDANGRPLFFGFRESVVESSDQAARFQRTFSNRAAVMLQGVEQWIGSQNKTRRIKSALREEECRVGIGVYLVQGGDGCARSVVAARGAGGRQSVRLRGRSQRGV